MTQSNDRLDHDEISRVAKAIWEEEGRPEGCDHDHWMRARRMLEERGAEAGTAGPAASGIDAPRADAAAPESAAPDAARPVQPGFEDVPPGIVPAMKADDPSDVPEEPGGRFAKQLADLPDEAPARAPADEASEKTSPT